jgi:predicted outer membrane repeat protein
MLTSSTASANAALVVSTLADSGVGSLRQAMLDANSAAGVDTITFTAGLTGTIDVLSDLPALDEGIDLQGPGASVITIDGGWTAAGGAATGHSLFVLGDIDVAEGASTISGVTITGGNGSNNAGAGGGAIQKYYGDADLTIADVVLTGNYAPNDGGAVFLHETDGTVAIRDSVISNNVANSKGGAIYSDGRDALFLTLTNVEITGNTAGDEGGGLYLSATDTTINNSTITANTASGDGGGINFEDGPFAVVDSTITGNTAGGKGGGIWIDDSLASISDTTIDGNVSGSSGGGIYLYETSMTISNSTLSGNSATYGGALYIAADDNDDYGSATFIENSTISGNHATKDGGAISIFMDDTDEVEVLLEIVQSTITDNSTDGLEENAGGIVLEDNTEATITGSIVAGNLGNDIGLYSTSLPSVTASDSVLGVIQTGVTLVDGGGTQVGVTDPMLGLLANNGGVTKTHALLAGSPAIDAGPNPVPVFDGNEFDQRGVGFARIVFGVADVGAFEVQEPPATEPVVPAFTG